jgi:hypothetical protein
MSKWRHIGLLAPGGQRLWEGCVGEFYLTDQSADDVRSDTIETPDDTEDGPCRILRERPVWVGVEHIAVTVVVERTGKEGTILVSPMAAGKLVDKLGVKVQLGDVTLEKVA